MQLQVRLPCGDFKLAGLCWNDCTALAAGRTWQAFGSPLCTPCWHRDLSRTQTVVSYRVQLQLWKHRLALIAFTMPAHRQTSSGRISIWKAKWNERKLARKVHWVYSPLLPNEAWLWSGPLYQIQASKTLVTIQESLNIHVNICSISYFYYWSWSYLCCWL